MMTLACARQGHMRRNVLFIGVVVKAGSLDQMNAVAHAKVWRHSTSLMCMYIRMAFHEAGNQLSVICSAQIG